MPIHHAIWRVGEPPPKPTAAPIFAQVPDVVIFLSLCGLFKSRESAPFAYLQQLIPNMQNAAKGLTEHIKAMPSPGER